MNNKTHPRTNSLGVFGWNFSSIINIKLTTDSDDNVYIHNLGIESVLPSQQTGVGLYNTSESQTPLSELLSSPYSLNLEQLIQPYSDNKHIFTQRVDGSYQGNGTLSWKNNHYELEENNGRLVVFRADGQLNYVEDSNGYRLTAGYTNDLLTRLSASSGDSLTFDYNADGRIETVSDNNGQTNSYSYDSTGQYLLSVEDANGTTSFTYEDGTQDKYSYNTDGLLTKSVNRRGLEIVRSYDANYQLTQETYEDGSSVNYTYDSNTGQVETISNSQGTTTFDYSQNNRQLAITYPTGRSLVYDYDELGRKTGLTIKNGANVIKQTSYSYDSLGRLDKLADGSGNLIVDYDYHPVSGQLEKETNGNGTYTNYSYDLAGQLSLLCQTPRLKSSRNKI